MKNNVNYLYIVDKGKVNKVSVEVGISNEKLTEKVLRLLWDGKIY